MRTNVICMHEADDIEIDWDGPKKKDQEKEGRGRCDNLYDQ
jgi:hypothetical protein